MNEKKYWARFGDAQREAGFTANQLQKSYSDEFIVKKVIGIIRKLKKFPTYDELRLERNNDPELPTRGTFQRYATNEMIARKILEFCKMELLCLEPSI